MGRAQLPKRYRNDHLVGRKNGYAGRGWPGRSQNKSPRPSEPPWLEHCTEPKANLDWAAEATAIPTTLSSRRWRTPSAIKWRRTTGAVIYLRSGWR
jgi:hypothetical protein